MAEKVLYDGWPLSYQPNGPAAIHLLTLLVAHPRSIPAGVALPAPPFHRLPDWLEVDELHAPDSGGGRLRWEQSMLPEAARRSGFDLIHTTGSLALFGSIRGISSPAGFEPADETISGSRARQPDFAHRLRDALGRGGLSRARALLWPADLPSPAAASPAWLLPPVIHPLFQPPGENRSTLPAAGISELDLPETFILYHGPVDENGLRRVLDAWSWAAGSIGEYYPLLLAGCRPEEQERLAALLAEYQLTGAARPLPPLTLPVLAEVYRRCTALFHPFEISPWGDPLRLALACARPVVGLESELSSALVGPAAYLAGADETYAASRRALGAALITVVVEEALAESLARSAAAIARNWRLEPFQEELEKLYRAV